MMVGDVDQMLMRFAGAKPEILTSEVSNYIPDIETHKLKINYRSTVELIETCKRLIAQNYSDEGGPYSQEFFKEVQPRNDAPVGEPVTYSSFSNPDDEGRFVANEIKILLQDGSEPQDFFVGARTRAQLAYLEGQLARQNIPYINITGGSFWQLKHVQDVVAYLRLAYDFADKEAFLRVYNIASINNIYTWKDKAGFFNIGDYCPHRWLNKAFISKCQSNFEHIDNVLLAHDGWRYQTPSKLYDEYGPSKAQDLQEFVWQLHSDLANAENAGQVIQVILDECYIQWMKTQSGSENEEGGSKIDDLAGVVDIASEYTNVKEFLDYVNKMVENAETAKTGDWSEHVILSTVHRLKGLERDIVFGIGLSEGIDTVTEQPRGLLPHTFSLTSPPQFGVLPGGGMSRIEDERCICFVLVSRAKSKVYLSGVRNYRESIMEKSRFIEEMRIGNEQPNE